jgi:hypothetical protein
MLPRSPAALPGENTCTFNFLCQSASSAASANPLRFFSVRRAHGNVTKIVELAKAGRKGDDLAAETLCFFDACEPEHWVDRPREAPSINAGL